MSLIINTPEKDLKNKLAAELSFVLDTVDLSDKNVTESVERRISGLIRLFEKCDFDVVSFLNGLGYKNFRFGSAIAIYITETHYFYVTINDKAKAIIESTR